MEEVAERLRSYEEYKVRMLLGQYFILWGAAVALANFFATTFYRDLPDWAIDAVYTVAYTAASLLNGRIWRQLHALSKVYDALHGGHYSLVYLIIASFVVFLVTMWLYIPIAIMAVTALLNLVGAVSYLYYASLARGGLVVRELLYGALTVAASGWAALAANLLQSVALWWASTAFFAALWIYLGVRLAHVGADTLMRLCHGD
ncbi:MAG: hypothetical protein QW247_10655 [Pyrobaculum sp.]